MTPSVAYSSDSHDTQLDATSCCRRCMAAATPVFRTPTAPDVAYRDDGIHVDPRPTHATADTLSISIVFALAARRVLSLTFVVESYTVSGVTIICGPPANIRYVGDGWMRHSDTVSQHGLASDVSRRITSPRDHAPPISMQLGQHIVCS